jgi:hypothetical protein
VSFDRLAARAEALLFRARAGARPRPSGPARPFVYVGALRRTGSTLLAELLTELPHSFVFHEPGLAENGLRVDARTAARLRALGVDVEAFARRWGGRRRYLLMGAFKHELLPALAERIGQIGVKEVTHDHWRRYQLRFPDMKTLLTARDPRDVYLSIHERRLKGKATWRGPFTPAAVAAELEAQFRFQREMFAATDCLKVRYEDLCTDPACFERVKSFVGSAIPKAGAIGSHLAATSNREDEADEALRKEAQRTLELMPEYCEFWGYEP